MFTEIHQYLEQVTPPRPAVMRSMERYAKTRGFPIIGPLVGRFLYQAARLTGARRVLELGSGFGYSAYWFLLAMGARGNVVLTDTDSANRDRALKYFRQARLKGQITFEVGDALEIAAERRGKFDIVLNDIDKQDYTRAIDIAAARLRPGGLFITDNVIWSGKVCRPRREMDATTRAIDAFNRRLYRDSRFYTTILPIRDGIAVALRLRSR